MTKHVNFQNNDVKGDAVPVAAFLKGRDKLHLNPLRITIQETPPGARPAVIVAACQQLI